MGRAQKAVQETERERENEPVPEAEAKPTGNEEFTSPDTSPVARPVGNPLAAATIGLNLDRNRLQTNRSRRRGTDR